MNPIWINLTYACNRSCDYCFAKGFLKRWPKEITLKGLDIIFKWLTEQKVKTPINFIGGEPAVFSKINSALKLAEKRNFKIVFCTNGVFDIKKVNINSPAISAFGVTLNPHSEYSPQELKVLYSNLRVIRRNKGLFFRFNITSLSLSYDYLINACEKLNVRYVEFGLVFPSVFGKNKYISNRNLKNYSQYISKFVRKLQKHNIQPTAGESLPFCLFSKKERDFLIKNSKLRGVCDLEGRYAITPDLTVLPCIGLAIEGPHINTFKTEKELVGFFKKTVNELRWEVNLFPECKDCVFRKNKQCQGGCLTRKFIQTKKPLSLTA